MTEDTSRRLQELRQRYFASLPTRRREIAEALGELHATNWSMNSLRELHRRLHMVVGAAGSFSHAELRDPLLPIEEYLGALLDGGLLPSVQDRSLISTQVEEIIALMQSEDALHTEKPLMVPHRGDPSPRIGSQRILIVDDDLEQARHLALQLEAHGVPARVLTRLDTMEAALDEELPAAILMDIIFPDGDSAGLERIAEFQKRHQPFPPLIFISVRTDFQARLRAAHAGASAFFPKPVDVNRLFEHLNEIQPERLPEPFRVLIIDDDAERAAYRAGYLTQAGMRVQIEADPGQVMAPLVDFRPEVLLLSLHMAEVTGLDVTTVLRQQEPYVSLPIILLGQFDIMPERLRAVRAGADDFLATPLDPRLLVCTTENRARRQRRLLRLVTSDGLTGLLTHDAFMTRFEQEAHRCQRQGDALCLAIIDIDHFKQINDTWGHIEGNRVLRTLARLLRGRFRGSDAIGRFGGDELCVLMADTELEPAYRQLEAMRLQAERYVFETERGPYGITISAGLAATRFTPSDWRDELRLMFARADAALYDAKQSRNRIAVAPDNALSREPST